MLHYDGKIAIGVSDLNNVSALYDLQIGDYSDRTNVGINSESFDLDATYFNLNSNNLRVNNYDGFRLIDNYSYNTLFQARQGEMYLGNYNGDALLNVNTYDGFEIFDGNSGYYWSALPIFKVDMQNSRVGIGTDNPNSELHVVGDVTIDGDLNVQGLVSSSDRRYKKDIMTVENALNKVLKLRGVNYYWRQKDFPNKKFDNKLELGLIAQEVESIIPEVVGESSDGYKAVEYQKLVALLIEAIKEQQSIIDNQKEEMSDMRAELDSRLKVLEEILNTTTLNK